MAPRERPSVGKPLQLRPSQLIDLSPAEFPADHLGVRRLPVVLEGKRPPVEVTLVAKSTPSAQRQTSTSWVPLFSASPVPQCQNQCQL